MSAAPTPIAGVSILETMRLEGGRVVRQDLHLARAAASAEALGHGWNAGAIRHALAETAAAHRTGAWRVRLLVAGSGQPVVECVAFAPNGDRVWRVALAAAPVDSSDRFLRHKTTRREIYNRARASRPDVDDVLLWNERGEITESSIANVVVEIGGTRLTPPLACGLLPGVFRATLVDAGEVEERVLSKHDVATASGLWLINSLREWIPASLVR
jgi:branched-subunit amino acid aminotransferase/4-amino-4-deoxychorismate lyase